MFSLKRALNLKGGGVISFVGGGGKTSLMFRTAAELTKSGDSVVTTTTTKILRPTKDESREIIISPSMKEILETGLHGLKSRNHVTIAREEIGTDKTKLKGFLPEEIDHLHESKRCRWILVEADGAKGRPLKAPAAHEPVIPGCSLWVVGVLGLDAVGKPMSEKWVFRPERFAGITGLSFGEPISESTVVDSICHEQGLLKGSPIKSSKIVFLNKADDEERVHIGKRIAELLSYKRDKEINSVVIGRTSLLNPVISCIELGN